MNQERYDQLERHAEQAPRHRVYCRNDRCVRTDLDENDYCPAHRHEAAMADQVAERVRRAEQAERALDQVIEDNLFNYYDYHNDDDEDDDA